MTEAEAAFTTYMEITTELIAAYVSRNAVPAADLPNLIRSIHTRLSGLGGAPADDKPAALPTPAVPIRKSVTEDYIISLEDGKRFKSLKRYLMTSHGMTPAEYRAKWGLAADYPMVAPAYAKARSALAKTNGLGRKAAPAPAPAPVVAVPTPEPEPEPTAAEAPKRRGRPKKAA